MVWAEKYGDTDEEHFKLYEEAIDNMKLQHDNIQEKKENAYDEFYVIKKNQVAIKSELMKKYPKLKEFELVYLSEYENEQISECRDRVWD